MPAATATRLPTFARVQAPTTVVRGARDSIVPPGRQQRW